MAYLGVDLNIPVSEVDSIIGTASNKFDSIRLYSAPTRGGTYSLVTTITLVAGDTIYTYSDVAGTTTTWYKVTFYNSVTLNETSLTETEPFPAARDILTRKELRQKIVKNLAGKIGSPSAITAQTVVVAALTDTANDVDYYTGWHLYRPDATSSADNDRRVSSITLATGTLTHGGAAYADTTSTSEQVEILPLDLDYDLLNEKINDGLEDTRWLTRFEMGTNSGQNQYTLPSFIEGPEYVPMIWRRFGGTADSYIWKPINHNGGWAKVRGSNFKCTLDIDPSIGDNEVIALEVWRPGAALDSETDFTTVQQKWAVAAAMVEVLEYLVGQDVVRHQTSVVQGLVEQWKGRLRKAAKRNGPTPGMVIQPPSRISGFPSI